MSYDPERENKSELLTAWSTVVQGLPYKTSASNSTTGDDLNTPFSYLTIGEGDGSIISDTLTPAESLYGFFVGDIRIDTDASPLSQTFGDIFAIRFDTTDGDLSYGGQSQRNNRSDDQCYSIASSAKLVLGHALRCSGDTLPPWVRVLGIMIEEG
jgi:hypothetical protein